MNRPVVGFVGLTHLGLVSAVAAAAKGFAVVACDPSQDRVRAIARGDYPVSEPGLRELAGEHGQRLTFAHDAGALGRCDVVYLSADVPTDDRGESDLGPIRALLTWALPALRAEALFVVLCQVPPGFTRQVDFAPDRLFYQVETLIFGRAVERALAPERLIVGCANPGVALPSSFRSVLEAFGRPILPMRYESAELCKIAINCCLAAQVTAANTLAGLAERIGADWSEIVPALRLDRRIGEYAYLAPGLGLAGGNLERDLATVSRLAEVTGTEAGVMAAFIRNSAYRRDWVLRLLHAEVLGEKSDAVIGILGLAYKENTDSTKNSPALALIAHLQSWPLRLFDPAVPASAAAHPQAIAAASPEDAAEGVDALAIMTPWPAFRRLDPAALARAMRGRAVIDPYRVLDGAKVSAAGLDYFTLGLPPRRARQGGARA